MKKRILYTVMSIVVVTAAVVGCSKSSSSSEDTTSIYGQVTAIDGKKITVALAEEPSQGEAPSGEQADGTSPEKPEGDTSSDAGQGGPGGQQLTLTGEEQVITVTDDTEFLKSTMGGGGGVPDGEAPSGEAPGEDASDTDTASGDATSSDATSNDTANSDSTESNDAANKDDDEAPANRKQPTESATLDDLTVGDTITVEMSGTTVVSVTISSAPGEGGGDASDMTGSSTGSIELTGVCSVDGDSETSEAENFEATEENQSAVLVKNSGTFAMTNGTLIKSGDTTSGDESNFYGLNAVFAATSGSGASVSDTSLTSASEGSNAIFSTGEGTAVHVNNVTINTTGNSSRGLDATYGGSIDAQNVTITTAGSHSAPIATDRGEGTVTVDTGTLSAAGDGSPCIYSTGDITAKNVTGTATGSQAAVVEGKNSISLENCDLTGAGLNGVMLYQSTSGDAGEGTAILSAKDSKLTTISTGPMFYVTNTDAEVTLENTTLKYDSGILVQASGNNTNNWGTEGSNGGNLVLTGVGQTLTGDITCDDISTVEVNLTEKSALKGAVNSANTGKEVSIILDKNSKWEVTGNSYVTVFTNADESCANIVANGHTIYYDASNSANEWLGGKTIESSDGGKITPM